MRTRSAAMLGVVFLAGPRLAQAQQANINLDYNPQKNTESLIPFGANSASKKYPVLYLVGGSGEPPAGWARVAWRSTRLC